MDGTIGGVEIPRVLPLQKGNSSVYIKGDLVNSKQGLHQRVPCVLVNRGQGLRQSDLVNSEQELHQRNTFLKVNMT